MKKINTGINSIRAGIKKDTLIISSEGHLKALSSAVLGGGFLRARYILNHHVERNFSHDSPALYLKKVALDLGITGGVVGMMTAADLNNLTVANSVEKGLRVAAVVTGGVSNAAAAGEENATANIGPGTINTILLIDGRLAASAMVGAVVTASEAKTAALRELGVKNSNGQMATGTTTDAIVIACTGNGASQRYAGTGTPMGGLVGKTAKKAIIEAIQRQEGWW